MRDRMTLAQLAGAGTICLAMALAGCAASVDHPSPAADLPPTVTANAAGVDSDRAQIKKPVLHTGDVWIDRIQGSDREFRIEGINDGTMDVSFWGTEMTTDDALNVIVYRSLTQSSSEPTKSDKPGIWFAFPLYSGKTWEDKYNWELLGAAPAKGKGEDRGSVLGWEDVTVPAGTFHALKVVVLSRYYGAGGYNDDSTLTFWYAAEVNRFVKFDYRDTYDGALFAELVSYKPSAQSK
ncbi:hypothetical protein [Candidatus Binatus sp.]|uniref:hypothetical protein n=2 Tax=Candidatus Binatus sp. TaxID=2811406 RepID=UPI003CC57754